MLGVLLLGGFVVSFVVPFGLTAVFVAFAALFLVQDVNRAGVPVPAP